MSRTAVVAGVGPGLGESPAREFVDEGCRVGLFARSADFLDELAGDLGEDAPAVPADVTDPESVADGFAAVREARRSARDVLVNNASGGAWKGLRDISPAAFERAWRVSAYGALLCSREAVDDMLAADGGTVIFTGPRPPCGAANARSGSARPSSPSGGWRSRWRANSAPRASTSRTSSSTDR